MTGDSDDETEKETLPAILIKKYPNRRLYNTQTSSYIVLDDIVELIKSGVDFRVEDTKTGEDLTRSILNQVIYERETTNGDHHFPLDVQKQLILMYDDAYGRMVPGYLRESMNLFVSEREKMKNTFDEIISKNSQSMAQFGEKLASQNLEFFNRSFEFFQALSGIAPDRKSRKKTVDEPITKGDKEAQLKEIQQQIDELQAQLKTVGKQ